MTVLADIQPFFLPWRGFFDIIHKSDIFVFYDDGQYVKGSWSNRNKIKTADGVQWITVPVQMRGHLGAAINEVRIVNALPWKKKHLRAIEQNYRRAPYFDKYFPLMEEVYAQPWDRIADLDIHCTKLIARLLGLEVRWILSSELGFTSRATDRLVEVCTALGADVYVSGPAGEAYLEPEKLERAGVRLEYQVYDYPAYPQLHGPFEPAVSIVDVLMNTGPEAPRYIWGEK